MPNRLKINIRTKIIISYLLVLVSLGVFLWIVSGRMTSLQQEADFIGQHDIEVHKLAHEIEKNMLELVNGQRGFVITGDTSYLEPYKEALSIWETNYNKLVQLIEDNSSQVRELTSIKNNIETWIEVAGQPAVRLKQAGQNEEALQFFINDPGQPAMETLRSQFTAFRTTEREMTAARVDQMKNRNNELLIMMYGLWGAIALITLAGAYLLSRSIVNPITQVTGMIREIAEGGNLSRRITVNTRDEVHTLAAETNKLLANVSRQSWIKDQVAVMSALLQNADTLDTLTRFFTHRTAGVLGVPYAALFLSSQQEQLVKAAAFADPDGEPWNKVRDRFSPGEGLVGQCMVEKRMLIIDDIPPNYIRIESGLGDAEPTGLLVAPVILEDEVLAVLELALFKPMGQSDIQLLEQFLNIFGNALNGMSRKMEIQKLYQESQALNEELQVQSEELQAHSTEIERYARQVEQSSSYKSQFLANMSHELRTPLNSMLILSQILFENKNRNLSDEEQNYAAVIHKSGSELLTLINDILDLSKVEAGKLQIEMDTVNLSEIPDLMHNYFGKTAENKNLQFNIEIQPDVPTTILSDVTRLLQILRNLISNAVKFTEKGSVILSIRTVSQVYTEEYQLNERAIVFEVSDTGIGISPENLDPIFEAFRQGDEATARKFGGTGLGLTISLQLAHLLRGHITAESQAGVGSKFTLYLPARPAHLKENETERMFLLPEAAAAAEQPVTAQLTVTNVTNVEDSESDPVQRFENQTVLIVDDDIRNVYGLANVLEKVNMRVLTAQNGYECLEMLEAGDSIDVILMDIMMPEMDGFETLKRIRQQSEYDDLPIIILSARAMKEEKERCLSAGAAAYVVKPAKLSDVLGAITSAVMKDSVAF
ncbi:response regulator [Paenibacillus lemnae]|uniref:Circadian input-output histidine kinase CikA n=1 Tax=Paenibacillus lemnae TaxID=1330551 RepID=A0A848M6M8_PAELE|nr:response regulator [Paenibacillus lemnae]NMO96286.1 response regulator [Paenibacillus lemnae]